jgi:hypothetical protein
VILPGNFPRRFCEKFDEAFAQHLARIGVNEENAMDMRRSAGFFFSGRVPSLEPSRSAPSSAPPPPAVNVATEWLDELDCVCPKAVDYASQCPKGHLLVPFSGAGCGVPSQSTMCRICHTRAESEQAVQWLVCSAAGCCAGYAVCDGCVIALHQAPAAVAAGEGFCSQVNLAAGAARCFG